MTKVERRAWEEIRDGLSPTRSNFLCNSIQLLYISGEISKRTWSTMMSRVQALQRARRVKVASLDWNWSGGWSGGPVWPIFRTIGRRRFITRLLEEDPK